MNLIMVIIEDDGNCDDNNCDDINNDDYNCDDNCSSQGEQEYPLDMK